MMNMMDCIQHRDAECTEFHRENCPNCDFSVISMMNMMDAPASQFSTFNFQFSTNLNLLFSKKTLNTHL